MKTKQFLFLGILLCCFSMAVSQEKPIKKWQVETKIGTGLVSYLNSSGVSHLYPTENKTSNIGYHFGFILNHESHLYFGIQALASSVNNMLNTNLLKKESAGLLSTTLFVGEIFKVSENISIRSDAGLAMLVTSSNIYYNNGNQVKPNPSFGYAFVLGGDFLYHFNDNVSLDFRLETQLGEVKHGKLPADLDAIADKSPNLIELFNTSVSLIRKF